MIISFTFSRQIFFLFGILSKFWNLSSQKGHPVFEGYGSVLYWCHNLWYKGDGSPQKTMGIYGYFPMYILFIRAPLGMMEIDLFLLLSLYLTLLLWRILIHLRPLLSFDDVSSMRIQQHKQKSIVHENTKQDRS